jgi:hypothetical protein
LAEPSAELAPCPSPAPAEPAPPATLDRAAVEPSPPGACAEPTPEVDWRAFVPTDQADHLATMDRAARNSGCGVPWQMLAAIARVESDFGRNMATSSAGAVGYGQFLPTSWAAFGRDGNVYDYRDALPAIAAYLCQSGLARDPRAALWAYNHADWYVDMVLGLAVRYDRLAPGAPTPDVLAVDPATQTTPAPRYASGRDLQLQARPRVIAAQAQWLGVPWHGRTPGQPITAPSLATSTLSMLRTAFGYASTSPGLPIADDPLIDLAARAWTGGLLSLDAPDARGWSVAALRTQIADGRPVVALVAAGELPGHAPSDALGDQPVVIIGQTPTGLIYNDPSFASTLGYGLELGDAEFGAAWLRASLPLRALAFVDRPAEPAREVPGRGVELPAVVARATASPVPTVLPTPRAVAAAVAQTTDTATVAGATAAAQSVVRDASRPGQTDPPSGAGQVASATSLAARDASTSSTAEVVWLALPLLTAAALALAALKWSALLRAPARDTRGEGNT